MKNPRYTLAVIALLLLAASLAAAGDAPDIELITPIGAILKSRDLNNATGFCVVGLATVTENKVGRVTGKRLFRGEITDATGKLNFFAFGALPPVRPGTRVELCGKYHKYNLHKHGVGYPDELVVEAIFSGAKIGTGQVVLTPQGYRNRPKP